MDVQLAKLLAVGLGTRPDFKEGTGRDDLSDSMGSGLRTRLLLEADDLGWLDGPGVAFGCEGRR